MSTPNLLASRSSTMPQLPPSSPGPAPPAAALRLAGNFSTSSLVPTPLRRFSASASPASSFPPTPGVPVPVPSFRVLGSTAPHATDSGFSVLDFRAKNTAVNPSQTKQPTNPPPPRQPSPILTLMPIQNEQVYYDETDDSDNTSTTSQNEDEDEDENKEKIKSEQQHPSSPWSSGVGGPRSPDILYSDQTLPSQYAGQQPDQSTPVVQRYQLYDPPMPTLPSPQPISSSAAADSAVADLSIPPRAPLSLEVIREEDEERTGYHSKGPSQTHLDVDTSDLDRDRQSVMGDSDLQPLQQTNHGPTMAPSPNVKSPGRDGQDWNQMSSSESVQYPYQEFNTELDRTTIQDPVLDAKRILEAGHHYDDDGDDEDDMELARLRASYHSRGSATLRQEMLSNASLKMDDVDHRVLEMESIASHKLHDIETKVLGIHGRHGLIVQTLDGSDSEDLDGNSNNSSSSSSSSTHSSTDDESEESDEDDLDLQSTDLYASSYLQSTFPAISSPLSESQAATTALIDRASIVELRQELQAFGMQYHELNDGLLTDLMSQMREAKLMLFETVDEVDHRLGMRVDRVEAEMHAKLLGDIESRINERVRAMEQTSARLESCFEKMDGRLGALETVMASKRPRHGHQHEHRQEHGHGRTHVHLHGFEQKCGDVSQTPLEQKENVVQTLAPTTFRARNESPESPFPGTRGDGSQPSTSPSLLPQQASTISSLSTEDVETDTDAVCNTISRASSTSTTTSTSSSVTSGKPSRSSSIASFHHPQHTQIHGGMNLDRRPSRIVTSNSMLDFYGMRQPNNLASAVQSHLGPYSAGPVPSEPALRHQQQQEKRRMIRAMTMESSVASVQPLDQAYLIQQHQQIPNPNTSIGLAARPKGAVGYVSSAASRSSSSASNGLTGAGSETATTSAGVLVGGKVVRRPSSYKELLHFWKAGSTPDLLKTIERPIVVDAAMVPAPAPASNA